MKKFGFSFWLLVIAVIFYLNYVYSKRQKYDEISYSKFKQLIKTGKVISVEISRNEEIFGKYWSGEKQKEFKTPYLEDKDLMSDLEQHGVEFTGKSSNRWFQNILINFGPVVLFILAWFFLMAKAGGGSKQIFSFGKARTQPTQKTQTTFKDVAGCEEVKEELLEIIKFLKDPKKFEKLGGKIPKGVILYGAPGTGKTLLARAVAGEAGVPFFSASGSEFVEMFVGVGASRVRDLFQMAKKNAPSVIFVDEIDAVGRHRGAGLGGGHDEREQTLNQLLVEMDGFDQNTNVIIIAATNRPDILDPALLRPGRFDRHIHVPSPNIKEREEILKVHAKKVKMAENVDLAVIARRTPGFVGSDLANIINESALLAARKGKESVEMSDIEEAIDRVIAGPEKKSRVMQEREKRIICYHESGHALVAKKIPHGDPVHKVSIIPRGPALGYTLQLPTEDRYLASEAELFDKIKILLGGRASEKIIFNQYSTGAQNDLQEATDIAYKMVTTFGMSQRLGPAVFGAEESEVFLGMDFSKRSRVSEKTKQIIDEEVKTIIIRAEREAIKILTENRKFLDKMAEELFKRENLVGEEIDKILNGEELGKYIKENQKEKETSETMENRQEKTDSGNEINS